MNVAARFLLIVVAFCALSIGTFAQDTQICSDMGILPEIESPNRRTFLVYGRVSMKWENSDRKAPMVVVWLREGDRSTQRFTIEGSGNYCFKRTTAGTGELSVDVDGQEAARRQLLPSIQQREDFEFAVAPSQNVRPPGVVSAKFNYKRNEKNAKLYEKALKAEADGKAEKTIEFLTDIVSADPADYVAWEKLGAVQFKQQKYPEAENALKRSVELKPDYTPAWLDLAQAQFIQKEFETSIESSKRASKLDPNSATPFYILGEAYLRTQQGIPAVDAFNEAIRLDPIRMAECHLILARLYDLNGMKKLASKEYRLFLAQVPDHPKKQEFEKYIKDNPE